MLSPGGKKPLLTEDGKKRRDPDDTRRWQVKKKILTFRHFLHIELSILMKTCFSLSSEKAEIFNSTTRPIFLIPRYFLF